MTKGRRTSNRHKRKRLPPEADVPSRGTQAGSLRVAGEPVHKYAETNLEGLRAETDSFLDKLRKRFRRGNR